MGQLAWRMNCAMAATVMALVACGDDSAQSGGSGEGGAGTTSNSGGSGAGELTCDEGLVACGETCVDTATDVDHCSGCGNACSSLPNTEASCADMACVLTCLDGYGECDGDESNGCDLEIFCEDHKIVFVSSDVHDGDLGGLDGADARCQALADAAGHEGTFRAWLSDGVDSPSTRFSLAEEPHLLVDGTLVASGWADLIDGSIEHAIDLDENGEAGPEAELDECVSPLAVWSGTSEAGETLASNCGGWLDNTSQLIASGDRDSVDGGWTEECLVDAAGRPGEWCGGLAPIYCFQQ